MTSIDQKSKDFGGDKFVRSDKFWLELSELFIDALWSIDCDGHIRVDPMKHLHVDLTMASGRSLKECMIQEPIGLENSEKILRAIRNSWTFRDLEFQVPGRTGDIRILLISGMPTVDDEGNYIGYSGAVADVTERRLAEEAARRDKAMVEASKQTQAVIAAAPICLLLCHGEPPRITFNNSAACEMFNASDEVLQGTSLFELIDDEHDRQQVMSRLETEGRLNQYDAACRVMTGQKRWGSFSIRQIDSAEGAALLVGIVDITLRKQHEIELRQAKDTAEQTLVELRDTQQSLIQAEKMAATSLLVAGVAHEINTPVGIVLTASTLLMSKTREVDNLLTEKRLSKHDLVSYLETMTEMLSCIETNITRTGKLVQSFKQVAVDQTCDERRTFDMPSYIQEVLVSLGPRLRKGGHIVQFEGLTSLRVDSYPGAFAQILTNLIINATQHAFDKDQVGRITITLGLNGDMVLISCADNGKGVSQENLGRIFDAFFTTRRVDGGTGLGLHIVYTLVNTTLRGTISVRSDPGSGTVFEMSFPRVTPDSPLLTRR